MSDAVGRHPTLRRLEGMFESAVGPLPADQARDRGWAAAGLILRTSGSGQRGLNHALLAFASELFASNAVELAADEDRLVRLIDEIETEAGLPRLSLGREILRLPQLLTLPTNLAVDVELAFLLALTKVHAVSLWTLGSGGEMRYLAHAGTFKPEALHTRKLSSRLLADTSGSPVATGTVAGVSIRRTAKPSAALVIRAGKGCSAQQVLLLEVAVPMVESILERDDLLANESESERSVLAATERRLARLRFDLHDGPQQDVILLGDDLRLFRSQLEGAINGHRHRRRLLGRLDDLQARLVALDGDLRRIAVAVQSPFLLPEPFPKALAQLTEDITQRMGIEPKTTLSGDFDEITDSQQIALLGLIREALSNIREHSGAGHVEITVAVDPGGIEAVVMDDGCGFDPDTTLVRAARDGHLGLVGMHERVRLLGGVTRIDSQPGGPTVISISLPADTAVTAQRAAYAASSSVRVRG